MIFKSSKTPFAILTTAASMLSLHALACGAPQAKKSVSKFPLQSIQSAQQQNFSAIAQQEPHLSNIGGKREELIELRNAVLQKRSEKSRKGKE